VVTIKKVEIKTVPLNTALIIGLIALVVGFISGNIYSVYKSGPGVATRTPEQERATQISARIFALERELKSNPNNSTAWLELGNLYFDSNKYQDSIQAYNKHLSLVPGNPDVWTDLGIMYRRNGNSAEAITSFDKALELNPRHEPARFNKGIVLYYDVGFRDEALKIWRELSEGNPNYRTPDGRTIKEFLKGL
jgi:tetratricopeptide (TPR) repeat protein